ncbi:hypothetical protein MAR_032198, partial [Mya arenaria]
DIKRDMDIEDETGKKLNAKLAGISSDQLIIALEPEAAAIYCRFLAAEKSENAGSLSTFKTGSKVLVIDSGGKESIDEFRRSNMEDYLYLIRDFEVKKRNIDPTKSDKPVVFRISAMLPKLVKKIKGKKIPEVIMDSSFGTTVSVQGDKLKVDMSVVMLLFKTQVDKIVQHVSNLIEQPTIGDIEAIVLTLYNTNVVGKYQKLKRFFFICIDILQPRGYSGYKLFTPIDDWDLSGNFEYFRPL